MIRLDRNYTRMVIWMCNVRVEDRISAEEPCRGVDEEYEGMFTG